MPRTYGAQQYAYQVLTAVAYALENKVDELSIEGQNYEDCCFKKNGEKTIGEAKYIKSKKHWTSKSLFYNGNRPGPLTQLWNRWSGNEELILFSPIPSRKNMSIISPPTIPRDEREEILEHIRTKIKGVRDLNAFLDYGVDKVLEVTHFVEMTFEHLFQIIIDWAEFYKVRTDKTRVSRLLTYLSSESYTPGHWISRESILTILAKEESTVAAEFTHEFLSGNKIADRVHFSLLWPRTTLGCARHVFGADGDANIEAVKYTIDGLREIDFVRKVEGANSRTMFKSTYKAIYGFCRNNILKRARVSRKGEYEGLTSVDERIFERIFDSDWFQTIFTSNLGCMHVNWDRENGLSIHEGLTEIAEFLEVINQIAACFGNWDVIGPLMPHIKDYDSTVPFDEFSNKWKTEFLDKKEVDSCLERVLKQAELYLGSYACTAVLLDSLRADKRFLCIPVDFAWKMSRCNRIQLTVAIAFCPGR
jgi:hypothetical protein